MRLSFYFFPGFAVKATNLLYTVRFIILINKLIYNSIGIVLKLQPNFMRQTNTGDFVKSPESYPFQVINLTKTQLHILIVLRYE